MSRNGQEKLYEGWLTKSPPTKRIWRGRWRRRWFSLHSGELPGQFILAYYTDRNCRKEKGYIDLDQCEQVDTGLKFEDKKHKFNYMFDIKTPTRTYYLAADTESEMKSWVKCICNVCGLKATCEEEDMRFEERHDDDTVVTNITTLESPPISPVSTSPYIPLNECITGKSPVLPNQPIMDFNTLLHRNMGNKYSYKRSRNHMNECYEQVPPAYLNYNNENDPRFYDCPRSLQPPPKLNNLKPQEEHNYCNFDKNASPLQSPTDSESVFTDDDWSHNTTAQSDQSGKMPRPSNSSTDFDVPNHKVHKLSVDSSKLPELSPIAPPRPPKSLYISSPGACYHNLSSCYVGTSNSDISKSGNHSKSNSTSEETSNNTQLCTDEMYDFPRSHQMESEASLRNTLGRRHCYNNAAPSEVPAQVFTYDNPSPKPCSSNTQVFRYGDELQDEPASPLSQTSSTAQYSNLPSPLLLPDTQLMPPPRVNRELKPKRKLSDSLSTSSNTEPPSPRLTLAPSVDRKLKPPKILPGTMPTRKTFENDDDHATRKIRAAPSPTPPGLGRSHESLLHDEPIYQFFPHYNESNQRKILEYLDLDLDNKSYEQQPTKYKNHHQPPRSPGANTVYKKVDFMKTEAFNITRIGLEKERNKTVPSSLKK